MSRCKPGSIQALDCTLLHNISLRSTSVIFPNARLHLCCCSGSDGHHDQNAQANQFYHSLLHRANFWVSHTSARDGEDDNDDGHSCHNDDCQVGNRLQALSSQLPLFSPTGMIHIGLVRVGRWVGVFIIVIIIIVKIIVVGRACSPRRGLSAYSSTKNQWRGNRCRQLKKHLSLLDPLMFRNS